MTNEQKGRPVVICTAHRGVFFGYAEDTSGETVKLKGARNAYYWECTGGVLQLGCDGPGLPHCRQRWWFSAPLPLAILSVRDIWMEVGSDSSDD